jgi:hypothetical protein
MGRHIGELCKVKSSPQEAERVEIPRCFLAQKLICITQFVQDRPNDLVFNLDAGFPDQAGQRKRRVYLHMITPELTIQGSHSNVSQTTSSKECLISHIPKILHQVTFIFLAL